MKLPKSVYYYWIKHMNDQQQKDQWGVEKVKEIVTTHKGRYGYRRIQAILKYAENTIYCVKNSKINREHDIVRTKDKSVKSLRIL